MPLFYASVWERLHSSTARLTIAPVLIAFPMILGAQRPQPKPGSKPSPTSEVAPRVKGIWEPVNYTEDIGLRSVLFASADVGWVSGNAGTIVKSTDGGAHWTAQLGGDAGATELAVGDLRFIDDVHGWATQTSAQLDSKLLRTTDGEHWEKIGEIPHINQWTYRDYDFTTPKNGAAVIGHNILITRDAGHTWKQAYNCETSAQVDGLARKVDCFLVSLSFISPDIGFALGGSRDMPGSVFIVKTRDGGSTWALQVSEGANIEDKFSGPMGAIAFVDEQHGVVVNGEGQIFRTADGGSTWHGVPGTLGSASVMFADPEVGWSIGDRGHIAFTTDAGQRWLARDMRFPATPVALSAPRRDRAYVVGEHGMVYRYRVVPVEYSIKNGIDAPALPAIVSPLDAAVNQLSVEVQSLTAEAGAGSAPDAGSGAAAAAKTPSASAGGAAANAARGGAAKLAKLQALLDAVGASMPQFLAKYHNLNLVFEGARTSAALPGWFETVKNGFASFRSASDRTAAAGALAQILSAADSLKRQTNLAFQKAPGAQPR